MSFDTHKNWFYELHGRFIHLWQWVETAATDTIDGIRVKLPAEYYGNQLIYPNEDISDGLRIEYTAFYEPFVSDALEDTSARVSSSTINFQVAASAFLTDVSGLSFVVVGGEDDTINGFTDADKYFYIGQSIAITGSTSGTNDGSKTVSGVSSTAVTVSSSVTGQTDQTLTFKNNGNAILGGVALTDTFTDFAANDKIRIIGSASNDADYTISSISSRGDAIIPSSAPSASEAYGESITIYQIPAVVADASVDESSHVNLNRMLSLAVVDFMKAQVKEAAGDLQGREYFMREFWKKVGDNESNKRLQSIVFPISPFAVK